jgi:hypothetical protein
MTMPPPDQTRSGDATWRRRAGHAGARSTMIILDILGAVLVIAMLSAMLNEDTCDNRIRIARS